MRPGFWDRQGGHCEPLQRDVWRNVVSPSKAVSLDVE